MMKKPGLLILLSLLIAAAQLVSCKGFLKAESSLNNDKNNAVVNADVVVEEEEKIINDTPEQYPLIFFENPTFDFGKIFGGQKVEHVFKFENRGNEVLKISKVKSSCGCTAAILTNKIVPPGKTGEIKATFSSGSYNGRVTKSITVKSNDPKKSSYKLTITGEVEQLISARPRNINFGSIYVGGKMDKTVTITSDLDFKIKKITPSKPFVNASIALENEDGYTINVALKNNRKIGRFNGAIYLETDLPEQKKVKIPFMGEIVGDIATFPKKIYYGVVKKGNEKTQKIFVKINKENIEILDIKVSPDYLSAKVIENNRKNNSNILIEVKLSKDAAIGKLKGSLEIESNSKMQPTIIIPIVGEIS